MHKRGGYLDNKACVIMHLMYKKVGCWSCGVLLQLIRFLAISAFVLIGKSRVGISVLLGFAIILHTLSYVIILYV